jgi:hypothetical protein
MVTGIAPDAADPPVETVAAYVSGDIAGGGESRIFQCHETKIVLWRSVTMDAVSHSPPFCVVAAGAEHPRGHHSIVPGK